MKAIPIPMVERWRQNLPFSFRDATKILIKFLGLIFWCGIFLFFLLEVKREYNIDVIPGYDSSVDDFYGKARGTLQGSFR